MYTHHHVSCLFLYCVVISWLGNNNRCFFPMSRGGSVTVYRLEKSIMSVQFLHPLQEKKEGDVYKYNRWSNSGSLSRRPECAQAIRKFAVLLADCRGSFWRRKFSRNFFVREIMLQLDIGLLCHLPHERIHLILRRGHGSRRSHRIFHVRRLHVQIRELRFELIHH